MAGKIESAISTAGLLARANPSRRDVRNTQEIGLPSGAQMSFPNADICYAIGVTMGVGGDASFDLATGEASTTTPTIPGVASALTTALTGSNNDLVWTAVAPGVDGDLITVRYVNPGTPSAVLSVDVVGTDITVNLGTNGGSAIATTAGALIGVVSATPAAAALVNVANAGGNDGSGLLTALAETPLSGGADPVPGTEFGDDGQGEDFEGIANLEAAGINAIQISVSEGTVDFEMGSSLKFSLTGPATFKIDQQIPDAALVGTLSAETSLSGCSFDIVVIAQS